MYDDTKWTLLVLFISENNILSLNISMFQIGPNFLLKIDANTFSTFYSICSKIDSNQNLKLPGSFSGDGGSEINKNYQWILSY